jgi:molybdopterin molybdotransferase
MIEYRQALDTILATVRRLGTERVELPQAIGRVLAKPVSTPWDMPRFDQSAMDGFAIIADDLRDCSESNPVELRIAGEQRIGRASRRGVESGTAVKIFTGSVSPPGADAVVMREYVHEKDGIATVIRPVARGENIRLRGEEFKKGDEILGAKARITPASMGLLASVNKTNPWVVQRPAVTCIVTGDELVDSGGRLSAGQIYDSNSHSLRTAIEGVGIEHPDVIRVRDDKSALESAIRDAVQTSEVVLTVGGASVGDYDYVREASHSVGVREVFWRVKVKPGKPVLFGKFGRRGLFFGLPGNPVSALVSFHQFVRPAILAMSGRSDVVPGSMLSSLKGTLRKKPGRLEWVRAIHDGDVVSAVSGQDSHMLGGLAAANCLIELPESSDGARDGDQVRIVPLVWGS